MTARQWMNKLVLGRTQFPMEELQPNQIEAVTRIRSAIEVIAERAIQEKASDGPQPDRWAEGLNRPTQVFSIFGDRGQGKTATLVSLCSMLAAERRSGGSPYLVAPVLEPELLNPRDDVFPPLALNLLYSIRREADLSTTSPTAYTRFTGLEKDLRDFIEDHIARSQGGQKLVADLSSNLETFARQMSDRNSEYLRRVDRFGEWISALLRVTAADVLIFPIDDADICRELSDKLLEAIRLYLSHPQVVVLMTAELETIRRSIRNRYLAVLPEVFTGGGAQAPDSDKNDAAPFDAFFGKSREQLLAQEFRIEDEYAEQFLYKVAPPAYRVQLRGLRGEERLAVGFSAGQPPFSKESQSSVSLEQLFAKVPLLTDALQSIPETPQNDALNSFFEELRSRISDGKRGRLADICETYPEAFSPILRVLANQVLFYQDRIGVHVDLLERILDAHSVESLNRLAEEERLGVTPEVHMSGFGFREAPSWPERLAVIGHNSPENDLLRLDLLQHAEDRFVKELIDGLRLNPRIERDHRLFFCEGQQANAFDGQTFSEFWELTDDLSQSGSGMFGFRFCQRTRRKEVNWLSDESVSMLNIALEYGTLRSNSVWDVLRAWRIDMSLNRALDCPRLALLRCIHDQEKPKRGTSRVVRLLFENLRGGLALAPSIQREESYVLHFLPANITSPSWIHTMREASIYYHNAYHSNTHKLIDQMVQSLSRHAARLYDTEAKKGDSVPAGPTNEEMLLNEKNMALRFMGLVSFRVAEVLRGLHLFMTTGLQQRYRGVHSLRGDLHWLMTSFDVGKILSEILKSASNLEDRFLATIYIAALPIGPLLCCWDQDQGDDDVDAHSLLGDMYQLVTDLRARYHEDESSLQINLANISPPSPQDPTFSLRDRRKPAIALQGLDTPDAPPFIRAVHRHVPEAELQEQADRLNSFIEILIELQGANHPNTTTSASAYWVELLESLPLQSAVQESRKAAERRKADD